MQRPSVPAGGTPAGSRHASTDHKRHSRSSIDGKRQGSIASVSSLSREYAPADRDEQVLYSPREEVEDPAQKINSEGLMVDDEAVQGHEKEGSNASNILDDMERFQREIDELRERYKKAA